MRSSLLITSNYRQRRTKVKGQAMLKRMVASVLVLSSVFCACHAEREYILKRENIWDNESSTGDAVDGWTREQDESAKLCNINANGEIQLRKIHTKDANRIYVVIEYEILYRWEGAGGNLLLETNDSSKDFLNKTAGAGKQATSPIAYDISKYDNYIKLRLRGVKICVKVSVISIYYYVCPTNNALKVKRTVAPREGFIKKSANCSIKQTEKPVLVVVAKCDNKGEWTKVEDKKGTCTNDCDAGKELINNTCTECKENYYKDTRGAHVCSPCPVNTVGEDTHTTCKCRTRTYRKSEHGPCKTIPSKPENLSYTRLPSNSIQLQWSVSRKDVNPDIQFRVKCQQYHFSDSWKPCQNLSLGKRGLNVTKSPLEIHNLLNNTNYTFSVTAVNDISAQVRQEDWKMATIRVHLPGGARKTYAPKATTPTITTEFISETTTKRSTPKAATEEDEDSSVTRSRRTTSSSSREQQGETVPQRNEKTTQFAPYIAIAIGAVLFIVLLIVIVHYRRKHTKKKTLNEDEFPLNPCPQAYIDPHKYGDPEKAVRKFAKEIDRRVIKLEGLIGEGEFAKVHKGMLCRPNEPSVNVALKVLKPGSSAKNREDFLTEAAVMGQFKDMNIVALEGVVTISHPVMIITEFMRNGALSDFLVKHKVRKEFSEIELLKMARGIASGMRYLARMRFVHRDLAARNVLVNENLVCKVADFGLTRELEESCQGEYVTQGGKIPIRWTAPEAYKHRRFTTASDVWSYGIVLWEIMSYADRPYGDWDNYMVMDQVTANYRLFAPTNCPKIVHQLMMECWKADRSQRPSFSDIVEMLERWIRNPYLLKDYQYVTEKDRMADRKSCVAKSIREYLEVIKMDRYIENFIDFGYTELYQIMSITDDDLVGIGVPLVGHRNKIIKGLQGERQPVDV